MNTALPTDPALRVLCFLEASTLLVLLLIAVPLKHLAGMSWVVSMVGPVHGIVFLIYCWNLVRLATARELTPAVAWTLALAASIPFGGFVIWKWLEARSQAVSDQPVSGRP